MGAPRITPEPSADRRPVLAGGGRPCGVRLHVVSREEPEGFAGCIVVPALPDGSNGG
jgi:hypothetical protein